MNWPKESKIHKGLVLICLASCALIYIFYRPEGSLINIFLNLFLPDSFLNFKESVRTLVPLNETIIYSLPGGLWVFSATLVSKNLRLKFLKQSLNLEWLPMTFALWLEALQYFSFIQGRFDLVDIVLVLIFGFAAKFLFLTKENRSTPYSWQSQQSVAFTLVFLCVFMAHVFE